MQSPFCVFSELSLAYFRAELQSMPAEWQHSKLTESSNMLYSNTGAVSEGPFYQYKNTEALKL